MSPEGNNSANHWIFNLLIIVVGAFMAILDSSIVNVAVPTLMNTFGVSVGQIEWVVTGYMLTLGVVVPASAWLAEKLGYKSLYLISMAAFILGSVLSGLSWSLDSMIAFRILQAVGGGMMMPVTMSMLYRLVPRKEIGLAMGIWGIAAMAAPAIGPTLGGYLVEYVNWRFIFYVNVPVGLIGLALAYWQLPHIESPVPGPFDWPGFITSASALFAILLALSEGPTWGWGSEAIVLLLAGSVVAAAFFVYFELTTPRPLLDIRIFAAYPQYLLTTVILVVLVVALFAGIFFTTLFLQEVRGLGPFEAGLVDMPSFVTTALLMPVSGRIFDRLGPTVTVVPGLVILAFTNHLLAHLSVDTPTQTVVEWMFVRGAGMGLSMMPLMTAGMSWIPTARVGSASAINNIVNRVSSSLGIAALTVLAQNQAAAHYNALSSQISLLRPTAVTLLARFGGVLGQAGLAAGPARATSLGFLAAYLQRLSFADSQDYIFALNVVIALTGVALAMWVRKAPRHHLEAESHVIAEGI